MVSGLIGKKLGMTRIFDPKGNAVPVTLIEVGPCTVIQIKSSEGSDNYDAVQLGYKSVKLGKVNKPMEGHFNKVGLKTEDARRTSLRGRAEHDGLCRGVVVGLRQPAGRRAGCLVRAIDRE